MSAGVIGGADGPTAIFVASSFPWAFILAAAIVLIGSIVALSVFKNK